MAIVCRRRSTPHPLAGRSAAEDGGGATFLPREEWAKPRGRKSCRRRCGSGDRGAAVLRLDQAIERPWVVRRTASSGEVLVNLKGPARVPAYRAKRRRLPDRKRKLRFRGQSEQPDNLPRGLRRLHREQTVRSAPTRAAFLRVRNTIFTARRRQPGDQEGEAVSAFGRAAATRSASEPGLPRDSARPTRGRTAQGEKTR
jgi:hypothetical protein